VRPPEDVIMQKSTGLILESEETKTTNGFDNQNNNKNNVCSDMNFDDIAD